MKEEVCCPKFNPKKWDEKTFVWKDKRFITETIPTFFHIPFPSIMNRKITGLCNLSERAKKFPAKKDEVLMLFHDPSAFRSEVYLSVTGEIANANNATISGTFMSKSFEGPYNAVPKFMKQMKEYLTGKGKTAKDYYIHYAYCPKCAKKYGNNYMVFFAKV